MKFVAIIDDENSLEQNNAVQKVLERVNSDSSYAEKALECNVEFAEKVESYLKNGGSKALFYKFLEDLTFKTPKYIFIKNVDGYDITIDLLERVVY